MEWGGWGGSRGERGGATFRLSSPPFARESERFSIPDGSWSLASSGVSRGSRRQRSTCCKHTYGYRTPCYRASARKVIYRKNSAGITPLIPGYTGIRTRPRAKHVAVTRNQKQPSWCEDGCCLGNKRNQHTTLHTQCRILRNALSTAWRRQLYRQQVKLEVDLGKTNCRQRTKLSQPSKPRSSGLVFGKRARDASRERPR